MRKWLYNNYWIIFIPYLHVIIGWEPFGAERAVSAERALEILDAFVQICVLIQVGSLCKGEATTIEGAFEGSQTSVDVQVV